MRKKREGDKAQRNKPSSNRGRVLATPPPSLQTYTHRAAKHRCFDMFVGEGISCFGEQQRWLRWAGSQRGPALLDCHCHLAASQTLACLGNLMMMCLGTELTSHHQIVFAAAAALWVQRTVRCPQPPRAAWALCRACAGARAMKMARRTMWRWRGKLRWRWRLRPRTLLMTQPMTQKRP